MSIVDIVLSYLPKRRKTPKGWYKFNAICCTANGESPDSRERGGILVHGDGITYHCFNCGFKAGFTPGNLLSNKFRSLLDYLNVTSEDKLRISHEALALREFAETSSPLLNKNFEKLVTFNDKKLPEFSVKLTTESSSKIELDAIRYIESRGLSISDFDYYVSKKLPDRVIIPYYFRSKLVGYVARKINPGTPKYLGDEQTGYVFNVDAITENTDIAIIVEGPLDALSINGISILGSGITDEQVSIICRLYKNVIVVPDRDPNGRATIDRVFEINQEIKNPWAISFPDWDADIKDSNDAVLKYGKIYTIHSIIQGAMTDKFSIEVKSKFWFPKKIKKYDHKTKY